MTGPGTVYEPAGFAHGSIHRSRRPAGPRKTLEVIRRLRTGESPSRVAAALDVPVQAVRLIGRRFRVRVETILDDAGGSIDGDDALRTAQGIIFGLVIACMAWAVVAGVYLLVAP